MASPKSSAPTPMTGTSRPPVVSSPEASRARETIPSAKSAIPNVRFFIVEPPSRRCGISKALIITRSCGCGTQNPTPLEWNQARNGNHPLDGGALEAGNWNRRVLDIRIGSLYPDHRGDRRRVGGRVIRDGVRTRIVLRHVRRALTMSFVGHRVTAGLLIQGWMLL